jgi:peptide/nickel transport system permease protein
MLWVQVLLNSFWMEWIGKRNSGSVEQSDIVIMGSVLVISTTFVVINILVDIIYAYLDPKIRLS